MKPRAEQGRNQAQLAKKQNRSGSGCEVVTYVRNICGNRYIIFQRDAPTEINRHIYTYIFQHDALTGHRYLINHVRREDRYIRTFPRDASAGGGVEAREMYYEKMLGRATRKYCIRRLFNVTPPPKT